MAVKNSALSECYAWHGKKFGTCAAEDDQDNNIPEDLEARLKEIGHLTDSGKETPAEARATDAETMLAGFSPEDANELRAAGYDDPELVREADNKDLTNVAGISNAKAKLLKERAVAIVGDGSDGGSGPASGSGGTQK